MPRCVHIFHDKCIQTCKVSYKIEPNYGVGPTMQKALKEVALFFTGFAGARGRPRQGPAPGGSSLRRGQAPPGAGPQNLAGAKAPPGAGPEKFAGAKAPPGAG